MTQRIAIIGGGIIGLTSAELIRQRFPDTEITVFDQDMIGRGASFYSVGLSFPFARSDAVRELLASTKSQWSDILAGEPSRKTLLRELDFVGLSTSSNAPNALAAFLPNAARTQSAPTDLMRTLGLDPAQSHLKALTSEQCQWGDVAGICAVLAKRLRQSARVKLLEACEIVDIDFNAKRPLLRDDRGQEHAYDFVVVATGPFVSKGPVGDLFERLGLRTKRIVALHIDSPPPDDAPVVFYHDADAFILPQPEARRWLYSFTCEDWDVEPDTRLLRISNDDLAQSNRILKQFAPALVGKASSGRCFCDAYGPERSAVVTPISKNGRLVFAGGASGSGFRLAPGIAHRISDAFARLAHPQSDENSSNVGVENV